MPVLNETHDLSRRSWIESANTVGADFPIQNLPYGVFSHGSDDKRVGVAIGDQILDLTRLEQVGELLVAQDGGVFATGELNAFMALPQAVWGQTRRKIAALLDAGNPQLRDNPDLKQRALVPISSARLHLPFFVRSFTDFYASKEHATNAGAILRGRDSALMPNWLHVPIGYNGRASTVVISGTPIRRPLGQLKGPNDSVPRFGPSERLDIELELGAVVGTASPMGQPITVSQAYDMIFGYVLLNDWSARDIQFWEYQPLGPFQAKAFGTSISPWIVTREALDPFRVSTPERIHPLLAYLAETSPNNFDINLEVALAPHERRPTVISRTNFKYMYYSPAQQLAHHASSGCAMCTGDLLGSGTISGPTPGSYGSLLELAWNGRDPIKVDGGERCFVDDYDTITLRGWCSGSGRHLGFGECVGQILPAVEFSG